MIQPQEATSDSARVANIKRQHRAYLCAILSLGVVTILQKLALPGSHGTLPLSVALVPPLLVLGFGGQVLELNRDAYIPLCALLTIGLINFVSANGADTSLPSLALFALAQSPLLFRFAADISVADRVHLAFRRVMTILAALGIAQFFLQFVAGPRIAFFLDMLPPGFNLQNFNVMNPVAWNSPIFKSNGVFLLEPSIFSQLICLAILLELLIWKSFYHLMLFGIAVLVTFSGTGLTTLAIFVPLIALRRRQFGALLIALFLVAMLYLFSNFFGLGGLTSRVGELSSQNSSGWARFVSPLIYLHDTAFESPWVFLLGHGPGSIEQTKHLGYAVFDPTWAKLPYEYGFVGCGIYFLMLYSAVLRSNMPLAGSLLYTYAFLGGYLLNPWMALLLAAMVVWSGADQISGSITASYKKKLLLASP